MTRHSSAVIFDLDDTLIDTTGVLVPHALRRVAAAAGVPVVRLDPRGKRIDEVLAPAGTLPPERRAAAAAAWYDAEVPPIDPLPGARELLDALHGRALLFLVTRGDPARQLRKVERCGLGGYFDEVIVRPIEGPGSKADDFRSILARHALSPDRVAVVGDDPDDELKHAATLGLLPLRPNPNPLAILERNLLS
jgi:putative hydrolase of the HAD superfamily